MDNLFESSMRLLLDYTRALHLSLAGPNFVALLTAEFWPVKHTNLWVASAKLPSKSRAMELGP